MAITNQRELDSALQAVAQFHERVPQFSGSELDASLMLERIAKTGRDITPDTLEETYYELHGKGLLDLGGQVVNGIDYQPEVVQQVNAPLTDSTDDQYDDYEIELAPGVDPTDLTIDGLVDSLSPDTLKQMIARAESPEPAPRQSVWDDVDSLSTTELAMLIGKLDRR